MAIVTNRETPVIMDKEIEYEVKPVKLYLKVETHRRIKAMAGAESLSISDFVDDICVSHLQKNRKRMRSLMEGSSS